MSVVITETLVEIFCDEAQDSGDFHIVFSRFGLPWILAPMAGMRIQQIQDTGEPCIYNTVYVATYYEARILAEHFIIAGWSMKFAMVNNQTFTEPRSLLSDIERASAHLIRS